MGKPKTAEDLVKDPKVQKYIEGIDADADAALDLAGKVLASATAKLYSSSTLASYKADVARLDASMGDFNAAWNKVVFGKAKSNKEIIQTYSKYVLALSILEEANTRHEAMMNAGFALFCAALLTLIIEWIKSLKDRLGKLEAEMKDLLKLLKKAEREVTEAKVQTGLNVAVTAITFCLGPVGWGARIGIALGSITTHVVIDAALGPSRGSALGTVDTVAGDASQLYDKLSKGSKTMAGGAAAVVTLKFDIDEIGDAERIVREVQKRIGAVADSYDTLLTLSRRYGKDIGKLKTQYDTALKAYESAAGKYKSSQRQREALIKEFKEWK